MPVTISQAFRSALYAQSTGEIAIGLLTIWSAEIPGGILRLTNHRAVVGSRGHLFDPFPFDLILTSDVEGQPPKAKLMVDQLDGTMAALLRTITIPPRVQIEVVLLSNTEQVEYSTPRMYFNTAQFPPLSSMIDLELTMYPHARVQFPYKTFNPADYPGAF